MGASFIKSGAKAVSTSVSETKQAASSGLNTSKFLTAGKNNDDLRVVPLVEYDSAYPDEDLVIGYPEVVVYWDKAEFDELKKTDTTLEGVGSIYSFPSFSTDVDIDVGLWLKANPEAFQNAKIKTSTMYGRKLENPVDIRKIILCPVLWLNKPEQSENNDEKDDNIRVLKIHQATLQKAIDGVWDVTNKFKHHSMAIKAVRENGSIKSYSCVQIGKYEGDIPTEFGFDVQDYVGFTTRQAIVDKMAAYGVIVPPVPEDKRAILQAIEDAVAGVSEEAVA